jgi:hypothetical protein
MKGTTPLLVRRTRAPTHARILVHQYSPDRQEAVEVVDKRQLPNVSCLPILVFDEVPKNERRTARDERNRGTALALALLDVESTG